MANKPTKSAKPTKVAKAAAKSPKPAEPTLSMAVATTLPAVANTGFGIVDPATGRQYYRCQGGSWLECDQIANQVGKVFHEIKDSEVPQSIRDQVGTA